MLRMKRVGQKLDSKRKIVVVIEYLDVGHRKSLLGTFRGRKNVDKLQNVEIWIVRKPQSHVVFGTSLDCSRC